MCVCVCVCPQVLQLDQSFVSVASRGGQPGAPRFPTLDTLLTQTGTQGTGMSGMGVTAQGGMRGDSGPLVSVLLQYVCYQDSDDIQVHTYVHAACVLQGLDLCRVLLTAHNGLECSAWYGTQRA